MTIFQIENRIPNEKKKFHYSKFCKQLSKCNKYFPSERFHAIFSD